MDTKNRPDSNLPARIAPGMRLPATSQSSIQGGMPAIPSAPTPGPSISPKSLIRGLLRHWWHILGLWLLVSLPVVYGIWAVVEPRYEASGLLQVEPTKPALYSVSSSQGGGGNGERSYIENFIQTQLKLINSHDVLEKVVTNQLVKDMNLIKELKDWYPDLRQALTVEAIKDTFLIKVSLQSKNPAEAYEIVKVVIRSYMDSVREYASVKNRTLIKSYEAEKDKLEREIDGQKKKLIELAGNLKRSPKIPAETTGANGGAQAQEPSFQVDTVTEEQFKKYSDELLNTKMELEAAESVLARKKEEAERLKKIDAPVDDEKVVAEAELRLQIESEFKNDPDVKSILDNISKMEKELSRVGRIARRSGSEPSMKNLRDELDSLFNQYNTLWEEKYDDIKNRVLSGEARPGAFAGPRDSVETLKEVEERIIKLSEHKRVLEKNLYSLKVVNKEARIEQINAELEEKQLELLNNRLTKIDDHLKQVNFETQDEEIRITIFDNVSVPSTPSSNKRIKLMAAAPVIVLGAFLGLFLLFEIKAERVSDPDALSSRVQSEVFALPPLPSAREVRKMRELENGSDQIDRFIQRLDHLRFAVCGAQTPLDNGRCVLVTSAVGGEGKTTLAAQLAARCGNAGMSTLLIDADMRRSSLGTLLDIPEGLGLSDVLKGDVTIEEAVVPIQGGTFHLLLAGTPIDDVSRILHGENFGILIARLRELYDLIIIDSPPVLPVPDALILGQWADGAILASRFDISRFPQVERARRQLDIAGISVLGTVINGMRSSDSYYGHYSYNRKKGGPPNSSDTN